MGAEIRARWSTTITLVFLIMALSSCAASSDSEGSGSGAGSSSASAETCEQWSALPIDEQRDIVLQLYQEGSSNATQSGANAAIRNVEYHCSQQPNLRLSGIDMDY